MEEAITGDYALVKAWKADKAGNLVFRYNLVYLKISPALYIMIIQKIGSKLQPNHV